MNSMKKLPVGIQTFSKIIENSYVYVDKTEYVYNLINEGSYYFLSRPRRFGKSLLLDTIAEAFGGNRELFKGLFLYDCEYEFEKHPVLRFDMSNIANKTSEVLEKEISIELKRYIAKENLDIDYDTPATLFKSLIEALHIKYNRKVVVLIDEYDKPILDHITDITSAEANRNVLRMFYGVLKSMDPHLRFTFITGITKFTKTSVFSGLNNLRDITMSKKYADICGIPTDSLDESFGEHIKHLSTLEDFAKYGSIAGIKDKILSWYDGYSWNGKTRLINPFSLLNFFSDERFSSFWFASGTPTFLIKVIKEKPSSFLALNNLEISERVLGTFDLHKMSLAPLLFQTGYMTIGKKYLREDAESYFLEIPNFEVREALYLTILADFTENEDAFAESAYRRIKESFGPGDLHGILETLKSLFASIPYQLHVSHEHYYHSIFYAIMNLLGFDIDAEVSVSGGRIDATLELDDKVYVIEFKYEKCESDATAEKKKQLFDAALDKGMAQLEDRGYAKKYAGAGKDVIQVVFAFLGRDDIEMRVDYCVH